MRRFAAILALFVALPSWAGRSFNGTSDLLSANGIGSALDISTGPQTISFWVYPTSVSGSVEQDMVTHFNSTAGGGQFVLGFGACTGQGIGAWGKFSFAEGSCSGLNPAQGNCGAVATPNKWYQITLGFDPNLKYSSHAVVFSVSGGLSCNTSTNGHSRTAGGNNLIIGGTSTNTVPAANFPGIIAEVAVWNDILSPQEMVALQTSCPAKIRRTALVGYFPLWGASGTSIEPDLSGNILNGTLTGTAKANHPPCTP